LFGGVGGFLMFAVKKESLVFGSFFVFAVFTFAVVAVTVLFFLFKTKIVF
jgi:hypothetical protein